MSIASEITRLQTAKADLKTAIEGKGVTVPSSAKLDAYPALVESIQQGGGSIEDLITKENLVRIVVTVGNYNFTLDASNNFTDESSNPKLTQVQLQSIKLIFADLELDHYTPLYISPPEGTKFNFLVVAGVEFSVLYTLIDGYYVHYTLYRNNEQIGYFIACYD